MKAKSYSMPAPVGGWNARDALADMDEADAVEMYDLFPTADGVQLKRSDTTFGTITGGAFSTLIPYNGAQLFAAQNATNDGIYNATAGGTISTLVVGGAGPTVQAITSPFFDYAGIGNTSGQHIFLVNGANTPLEYNGTTWAASSITASGLTATTLHTVVEYAERLWIAGAAFDIWYLPVNAIDGTAVRLNLASLFTLGGRINSIMTMSADTSSDLADFIAFVSTEGEIVVFTGTDPTDASLWARVAHLRVGRPVVRGNRCWSKYGADSVLLTTSGLLSLRNAMMLKADDDRVYLSDKIKNYLNPICAENAGFSLNDSDQHFWQVIYHPSGQKLIINTPPLGQSLTSEHFVMNTMTGAWTRYSSQVSNMCLLGDTLYGCAYGANSILTLDVPDTAHAGGGIALQAYNYLRRRGAKKYISMAKPSVKVEDIDTLEFGLAADFEFTTANQNIYNVPDVTVQDPSDGVYNTWRGVNGQGFAVGMVMHITPNNTTAEATWYSTDLLYEEGSPL